MTLFSHAVIEFRFAKKKCTFFFLQDTCKTRPRVHSLKQNSHMRPTLSRYITRTCVFLCNCSSDHVMVPLCKKKKKNHEKQSRLNPQTIIKHVGSVVTQRLRIVKVEVQEFDLCGFTPKKNPARNLFTAYKIVMRIHTSPDR